MLTFVKLGGSLITDKNQGATLRPDVIARIAREIRAYLDVEPDAQLLIGHGSGSFGHYEAKKFGTIQGVRSKEAWFGFASVSRIAAELNFHMAKALGDAGVPVMRMQPSASAIARNGVIQDMAIQAVISALDAGIIPLVYGDVAFDEEIGGTIISTETVFRYLTGQLPVKRILLVGEVDGVYDSGGSVIALITEDNFEDVRSAIGGSEGVDVTGGMLTKVQDMLRLASQSPYPDVMILNGTVENRLFEALSGTEIIATRISQSGD